MLAAIAGLLMGTAYLVHGQDSQFSFDSNGNLLTQATETVAPLQILAQPQTQLVAPGESATFLVVPADVSGLAYQWRFNGTNLPGATRDTLLFTNASSANEGAYSVVLANASGSVTSLVTHLYLDRRGVGMPDSWQLAYFGNLNQNPSGDFDGDGVNNLQEFLDGTNPTDASSALYRITVFNDGGAVVVAPNQSSYTNGQVVTLTATGPGAALFHAWTGDVVTRSNTITVTMNQNLNLFAHFQPFTLNWTNTVSGDWSVASNWFPNLVPGSNESVVIVNQNVTVTLNGNVDLIDFTLGGNNNGPELTGAGRLTISGTGKWLGGTLSGSGQTLIQPGATLTIPGFTGYGGVYLTTRTLENRGTMSWGGGNFYMNGGTITNDAGASFQIQGSAAFNFGGGSPRFDNAGTFLPAPAATSYFYGTAVNNFGAINLAGGSLLSLGGGGVQAGTVTVPAGATMNFAGGAFSGSPTITGAGSLLVSAGNATLGGTINLGGSNVFTGGLIDFIGNYTCTNTALTIDGGTVYFDGAGVVSPNVLNLYGSMGGANTVTVGSVMNWTGGTMSGTGRTVIPAGASLNIVNTTYIGLTDRTLDNAGTTVWNSAVKCTLNGSVITNEAGALFDLQNSGSLTFGGGSPRFDNAGTFRKSVSTGTASFDGVTFNNYGQVEIEGGVLAFNSCSFVSSPNSTLNCSLWGTTPGATYGQLQLSGLVNLDGTLSINLTNHFIPANNSSFTVLNAGSITGAFASLAYPSNNLTLSLSNGPASEIVRVTSVSLQPTNSLSLPPGIISWWRAENDAMDAISTNNGFLTNGAAFAPGEVGQSFLLDGIDGYVEIPDSPSLRPVSVTIEAWVKTFSVDGTRLIFAKPLGSGSFDSYGMALVNGVPLAAICDTNGFGTFISATDALTPGQWSHLAYTYDGTSSQEVLYVNGSAVASANAGRSMDFDAHPLLLGADIENGVPSYSLNGQIDEASLYNRALRAAEIASIYNVGSAGKRPLSAYPLVLHIANLAPTTVSLYWSTNDPPCHLEYNTELGTTNWAAVALTPVITGTNFVVTNALVGARMYYRLAKP